ncbi:MAG: hypothetical protein WA876_11215 [Candidatus Acidiferrales bacterium]
MSGQAIIVDPSQIGPPPVGKPAAQAADPTGAITVDPQDLTANTSPQQSSAPPPQQHVSTMGPRQPSFLERFLAPVREGAIGHSVQETMPRIAEAFPSLFEPTETASNPEEQQHASEVLPIGASVQGPGIGKGVAEFAGGMTTAPNMLLMAGGPAVKMLTPIVGEAGVAIVNRLIQAGFSASMLIGAARQSPELVDAIKNGDYKTAEQVATEMALGLAFAAHQGREAAKGAPPQAAQAPGLPATQELPGLPAGEPREPGRPMPKQTPTVIPPSGEAIEAPGEPQRALPAATARAALPPKPGLQDEDIQTRIGPRKKPIALPAQSPTRIPPSAEPIAAGPTTIDPRELSKSNGNPKAESNSATPEKAPDATELKIRIKQLTDQERDLTQAMTGSRPGTDTNVKRIQKLRQISAQRSDLRAQLEQIEPRPVAKPLSRPAEEGIGPRIGGGTRTGAELTRRPQTTATKAAEPKLSKTPTYDKLPEEMREAVDSVRAGHEHLPQSLREAQEDELKALSEKGTPMKEQFARLLAKQAGIPIEAQEGAATKATDLLDALRNRPAATPLRNPEEPMSDWDRIAARETPATLPGMETAVREQHASAEQRAGEELTQEFARPLSSIESQAGEMETKSPLFRGTEASPQREIFSPSDEKPTDRESLLGKGSSMHSGVDPTMVSDLFGKINRAYDEHVASPAIEKFGLGRSHKDIEEIDPKLASRIRRYENAPLYFRTKAEDLVKQIVGNLTPGKERLFTLMADADSRENLRTNHPKEYAEASTDKDVQDALARYRPWEEQLTKARTILGGSTLDRDYLRRVYAEHTAGIGQKTAKGQGTPRANFDRVITPQREGGSSRTATAEYHYQHGLHEFGPAFATKFVGTMNKLAEHATAMDFLSKATKLEAGDELPPFIRYNGERFYRPDVVKAIHEARPGEESRRIGQDLGIRELPKPKNAQAYEVYDPSAPHGSGPGKPKYLGPRAIVDTLHGLDKSQPEGGGPVSRFLREQIIGVGFGVPHVMNIMRRISHSFPAGSGNPVNWVRAARVLTDNALKQRALSRTNDPTYDSLLRWGGMSPHEVQAYKEYQGGNFNPANWLRLFAKVGHDYLFGPSGLDRRARLYVADLVRKQRPDLTAEKAAQLVNDQLGRYNRATWTEMQKRVGKFLLFPGWDFSSINWVLRHPIRTAVPSAILMMLANNVIHHYGGNRDEDRFDPFAIHAGHHSYGLGILNESLARRLAAPVGAAVQKELGGGTRREVVTAGAREIPYAAGAPFGMTLPNVRLPVEIALGKDEFGRDIVPQGDWTRRGAVLPNKGIEDEGRHALVSFFPQGQRIEEGKQNIGEMVLSNLGLQRRADQPHEKPPTERQQDVYNVQDDIRALERQAAAIAEDSTLSDGEKQQRLLPLRQKYQELIAHDRPR